MVYAFKNVCATEHVSWNSKPFHASGSPRLVSHDLDFYVGAVDILHQCRVLIPGGDVLETSVDENVILVLQLRPVSKLIVKASS